jgi:ABC-type dipeptide/oligopeptide/nickel transport system permease component/ABC-type transport system substrate-binding protein
VTRILRSLVIVALATWAAFAPAQAAPAKIRDTLALGMQLEPPSLDPTSGAASAIAEVTYPNVYEGLVRLNHDGTVKPFLAQSWTISPDGLIYIFYLRKNVHFQNGVSFDASAAKSSLDRARAVDSVNPQKPALEAVKAIDAVDPHTLRIALSHPDSFLLPYLAWPAFAMVEPRSVATDGTRPVGTGPFRFGEWRRGDSIILLNDANYWGAKARLSQVAFKFISDPTAAFAAMKSGDIQAFPNYPAPENLAQFKSDPRFAVVIGTTEGETLLAINNRNAPFNNLLVRRAISYALDREAIIDGAMYGYGTPIGSHYPPQDAGYVDLTGLYPHDIAKARALLAQAGYPNGFGAALKLPPPSYARRGGEIVAAELGQIGIRVQIENIEWAQWLDQVFTRHDFDLSIVSHVEPMDYDIYGRPNYYFGYSSPEFDALLAELKRTTDQPKRLALLQAIQRKIADDAVNGFLFEMPRLGVWDAHLKGFNPQEPIAENDLDGAYFDDGIAAAAPSGHGVSPLTRDFLFGLLALLAIFLISRAGLAYLAERALSLGLTLIAATVVIFIIIQVVPGDPAVYMMGIHATPQAVALLHKQLGLDHSLMVRYFGWIGGLLHGDFGDSYTYRVPVGSLIVDRLAVSLPLALYALTLAIVIAVPAGLFAALHHGGKSDGGVMALTQLGIAIPDFWFAILLVILFSMTLRWFSAGGFPGWDMGVGPALKALTLPAIALALPQAAILTRVLRSALLETMREPYMRTARAKGLTEAQALRRHALRNALIPVLTIIGLQFPFLVAGAIIIENVFFLPGLGRLVSEAIAQRDLIVVQGVVVVMVFAVVGVTFLVDLAYALVDPRIRFRPMP